MHRKGAIRIVVLLACTATAAPAVAGPREEVLARAAGCAALADDAAWLACYRAAAAPMDAALAAATASVSAVPLAPAPPIAPAPAPADHAPDFGIISSGQANELTAPVERFHPAPATAAAATDHITAHVLKVSFSSQRYFTLLLDNGQTWQQINGDDEFVVLQRPASEYQVTIKHGFFGSYNLTFAGVAGLFRVRRIT